MLVRLCLPLIVAILLKNIMCLSETADELVRSFQEEHRRVVCARQAVYRKNMEDGFAYLLARFDALKNGGDVEDLLPDALGCEARGFVMYREVNGKLPAVYPNWLYRESDQAVSEELIDGG